MSITFRPFAAASLAVLATLTLVPTASAQIFGGRERPERPSRALFGTSRANTDQSLILTGSLAVGRDGTFGLGQSDAGSTPGETAFWSATTQLAYAVRRSRFDVTAAATASTQYVNTSETYLPGYGSTIDVRIAATPRTTVTGQLSASHEPRGVPALFPSLTTEAATPATLAFDSIRLIDAAWSVRAGGTVRRSFGARSGVSLEGDYSESLATASYVGQQTRSLTGRFDRQIARGVTFRIGYGERQGQYRDVDGADVRTVRDRRFDGGFDISRTLSFSRRTTLALATGTSAVGEGEATRVTAVGSVNLSHDIGRSWLASLAFNRDADFVETLAASVLSDSLSASLGGMIHRRLEFHAAVGVSKGTVGIVEKTSFGATRTNGGFTVGLSRRFGLGVEYIYYWYDFDVRTNLPDTLARRAQRQSLQGFLTVDVPLVVRVRR